MQGFGTPPEGATAPSPDAANGAPASPEQQAEYNKFVGFGLTAMSNKSFLQNAQKVLSSTPEVVQAMAQIGVTIASRIYQAAKQQNTSIDPSVLVHGGMELMEHVGELASTVTGKQVTEDQFESAYYAAADRMKAQLGGDDAGQKQNQPPSPQGETSGGFGQQQEAV